MEASIIKDNNQDSISPIIGLLRLLRMRQWVKNVFVVMPLIFSRNFSNLNSICSVTWAALLFCVASSATYIINDISDIERDRKHPKKRITRPLAAGIVKVPYALVLLAVLLVCLFISWFFVPEVVNIIVFYVLLNLAYTFVFKHEPVVDIFLIATGFVLRVYAGTTALSLKLSSWMFVTTLCLSLFLASVKRRQELSKVGDECRKVLVKYSLPLVDRFAEMSATGALVFYSLFVLSERPELVMTVPLVLFGLFRYWYVVETFDSGESPTDILLTDWPLLATVALWVAACVWALWPSAG